MPTISDRKLATLYASFEAQKRLTETNLRSVEYQSKAAKLSKAYREKQEKVEELKF